MSFSLQSIRKFQKPLIFGLAVFLMVAFGVPWQQLFRGEAQRPDDAYMTVRGRDVTISELRSFVLRWTKVNRYLIEQYKEQLYRHLEQQFVLVEEARRAGLEVSDREVARAAVQQGYLLRGVVVEIARARRDDFKDKADIKAEDIEAYYNGHKESYKLEEGEGYKELESVRDDIEKILIERKTGELMSEALARARQTTLAAGDTENTAFAAAAAVAGLDSDRKAVVDNEYVLQRNLGDLAGNDEFTKKLFGAPIGGILGPFAVGDDQFIFRITARSAGFDPDGNYHPAVEGWTLTGYGEQRREGYTQLVERTFSPLTAADFEKTLREQMLVGRYTRLLSGATSAPIDTIRQRYYAQSETARVDYLTLNLAKFRDAAAFSEQELEDFYNQYKSRPAPERGGPGYLQPEMASIEYVLLRKPTEMSLSDKKIPLYYKKFKEKYVKDPNATVREYYSLEEVKEQVRDDLVADQFEAMEKRLQQAVDALEAELKDYLGALDNMPDRNQLPDLRTKKIADLLGLSCKRTEFFRRDGRDIGKVGWEFMQDREQLLREVFSGRYLSDEELRAKGRGDENTKIFSDVLILTSGSKYFFRVIDRRPSRVIPFDDLPDNILARVRFDKQRMAALALAREEARKMARVIRADAFDALAEELKIDPVLTEEFLPGELPKSLEEDSAIAKEAGRLKTGEMSRVVADGDSLHVVLCAAGEQDDAKLVWKILTFAEDAAVAGPELTPGELADYVEKNCEAYAEDVPLKGTATILYVAAKYEDVKETISPTDEEIEKYYDEHKEEFEGKPLDECRGAVAAAVKAQMAPAKADELLANALDEAGKYDKSLEVIAKDTPLTAKYVAGIELDNASEKESFVGKVENLARLIIATKENKLSGLAKTEDGPFFFKVLYKDLGESEELWGEITDKAKEKVKADLVKENSSGPATERAQLQLDRYVAQAFRNAPDRHHITVTRDLRESLEKKLQVGKELTLNQGGFTRETVETLMKLEANSLSDVMAVRNNACLFHVKSVQPLQVAKIEYVRLSVDRLIRPRRQSTGDRLRKAVEKLAREAGEGICAQVKGGRSLAMALAAVRKAIPAFDFARREESPYFAAFAKNVRGMGRGLDLLKKVFELEPGGAPEVYKEKEGYYVVRLLNIKPAKEAKVKYVRITVEERDREAVKKAAEAMRTLREEAEKLGSLSDALDKVIDALPVKGDVRVEGSDDYIELFAPPPLLADVALLNAIEATEAGEFTPVVRVPGRFYVAHVQEVRTPTSVTADWVTLSASKFSNPAALSVEDVTTYYEEHKEDYRTDKKLNIDYVTAKDGDFKEKAEKDATDDALKEHYESIKKDYEKPGPDGEVVVPEFKDVENAVKKSFVTEKSAQYAHDALAAAAKDMAEEGADLEAIAEEHGLEHRSTGFLAKTAFAYEDDLRSIQGLGDQLFSMDKSGVTDVQTSGERHFVFRVTDVKEPYIPEFDEVKDKARRGADIELQPQWAQSVAEHLRTQIEKALADGKTFEDAVKGASVEFPIELKAELKVTDDPFTRRVYGGRSRGRARYFGGRTGLPGEHPKFVSTAFALRRGEVSSPVAEDNERGAVYLLLLRDRTEPEEPSEKLLESMRSRVERMNATEQVEDAIRQVLAEVRYAR